MPTDETKHVIDTPTELMRFITKSDIIIKICYRLRENQAFVKNINFRVFTGFLIVYPRYTIVAVNCPFLAGDITTFISAILKRNSKNGVLKCFRILAPLHVTVSKVMFSKDRSVFKSTE